MAAYNTFSILKPMYKESYAKKPRKKLKGAAAMPVPTIPKIKGPK